jgi:hypothetical protein
MSIPGSQTLANPPRHLRFQERPARQSLESDKDRSPAQASAEEIGYQSWRELDGPVLGWSSTAIDVASSIFPSLDTGLNAATAGGARGAAYGAGLGPALEKTIMGANLAALGVAMTLLPESSNNLVSALQKPAPFVAAVAQIQRGFSSWKNTPADFKAKVYSGTTETLQKLFPNPDSSWQGRLLRGLAGEIVGLGVGGFVGIQHGFQSAQGLGDKVVDRVQRQLYQNMHLGPTWQRQA